jgi:uncharacterized protein (DUF2236 family)
MTPGENPLAAEQAPPLPEDDEALLAAAGLGELPPSEEGLFREGCWLRRVSGEPVLLFGGGRALLLEVAHPLVAAGVAAHSQFRADPFGRLRRTLDAMSAITFRDRATALAAARSVERTHTRVVGRLECATARFPQGTPYAGRQPDLMFWVWATLVDTAAAMYERFVEPLAPEALAAYYADHRGVARVLGVPASLVPESWPAFRAHFDALLDSDVLEVTPEAREIADAVLAVPGLGPARLVTSGLLTPRLRDAFGLSWSDENARALEALATSVRGLRSR